MEAIGSYISVVGLGSLFSGDIVILTMAVILDVAKIVTVSFLYQYWEKIKSIMRYYMLTAVIVLMTITSAGAFGYLSGAFQKALQPNMEVMLKVDSFKREQTGLTAERDRLVSQRADIDKQIAQLPSENVKGRRQLINSFKPETERIAARLEIVTKRVDALTEDILKVESQNIDQQVHVGPITYVSKAFGISVEDASKWIILTIIFVFDPLAVILIVAGNFLVKFHRDHPEYYKKAQAPPNESFEETVWTPDPTLVTIEEPQLVETVDESPPIMPIPLVVDKVIDEFLVDETAEVVQDSTPEIDELWLKVYDPQDTGEAESVEEVDDTVLEAVVQEYVPTVPAIDVSTEMTYSGSPQAELIDAPMKSTLEDLRVSLPDSLILPGFTPRSSKKSLYE